ncbi:MAG TPA: TPM domain-containing protein [Anaeromyxobacteraceae bacterium]|nr:TPM domain-containing protein [Anaeromyxobacteraceae bacterium]
MAAGRLATAALALALAVPAVAREVPALTGPVVDEAGLLDAGDRRRLEALSRAAWEQGGEHRVQLQYLLVKSLGGEDVEGFAVRVFEAWKLGEKGKDNGVLVVVSRDDRKVRIETGYGNEGGLTDAQSGRIIRNVIAPAFREGRYGDGLMQAGVQILSALGALPQGTARRVAQPSPLHGLGTLALVALLMLFVFGRMFFAGFGPRRRRWYGGWGGPFGGGWGGGGWGGGGGGGGWGGGGGGGWSGGGGRSGGGGASGGW